MRSPTMTSFRGRSQLDRPGVVAPDTLPLAPSSPTVGTLLETFHRRPVGDHTCTDGKIAVTFAQ